MHRVTSELLLIAIHARCCLTLPVHSQHANQHVTPPFMPRHLLSFSSLVFITSSSVLLPVWETRANGETPDPLAPPPAAATYMELNQLGGRRLERLNTFVCCSIQAGQCWGRDGEPLCSISLPSS